MKILYNIIHRSTLSIEHTLIVSILCFVFIFLVYTAYGGIKPSKRGIATFIAFIIAIIAYVLFI